jgi:hypothetical protein
MTGASRLIICCATPLRPNRSSKRDDRFGGPTGRLAARFHQRTRVGPASGSRQAPTRDRWRASGHRYRRAFRPDLWESCVIGQIPAFVSQIQLSQIRGVRSHLTLATDVLSGVSRLEGTTKRPKVDDPELLMEPPPVGRPAAARDLLGSPARPVCLFMLQTATLCESPHPGRFQPSADRTCDLKMPSHSLPPGAPTAVF